MRSVEALLQVSAAQRERWATLVLQMTRVNEQQEPWKWAQAVLALEYPHPAAQKRPRIFSTIEQVPRCATRR